MRTPSITDDSRVLVMADDPLARAGLAALLAGQPGCTVVGQVPGDGDLRTDMEVYRPDVDQDDVGWNPALALERVADVRDMGLPVLALVPDETQAPLAWAAGAHGLLLRDATASELVSAIRAVEQGLVVLPPELAVVLTPAADRETGTPPHALTPREMDVLRLLAEGLPNKSMADRLGVTEHTVKFHVNAIMGKLGAQSRTEAVVLATRQGLVLL